MRVISVVYLLSLQLEHVGRCKLMFMAQLYFVPHWLIGYPQLQEPVPRAKCR